MGVAADELGITLVSTALRPSTPRTRHSESKTAVRCRPEKQPDRGTPMTGRSYPVPDIRGMSRPIVYAAPVESNAPM